MAVTAHMSGDTENGHTVHLRDEWSSLCVWVGRAGIEAKNGVTHAFYLGPRQLAQ